MKNLPVLVAIPNVPTRASFAAAFEADVDAWLLLHPAPIAPATKGEIGRLLIDRFLRYRAQQLDALHWACHSPRLDKLVASLDESSRSRDRPISDKEFERRRELLSVTIAYEVTHQTLRTLRRQVAAGQLPETAQMDDIHAAVQILLGPLSRSERWLASRIGGQESQKSQFGSPTQKRQRREELRRMVKDCMAANPNESYRWATEKVGNDIGKSASWVRTLAAKHSL